MEKVIKRIALLGPESTGKTTLARQLAEHFHTTYAEEYGRQFLAEHNNQTTFEDLEHIGKTQLMREDELAQAANRFLFCDTETIYMLVWYEVVYGVVPEWLTDVVSKPRYDLVLLLYPDLPWVDDGFRVHPHTRVELFERYKAKLIEYKRPFVEIRGGDQARLISCVRQCSAFSRHLPKS